MFVIIIPIGKKKSQYTNGKKEFQLWSMNQWREWISNRSNVGSLCATYCIRQSIFFLLSDFFLFIDDEIFFESIFFVIYRQFFLHEFNYVCLQLFYSKFMWNWDKAFFFWNNPKILKINYVFLFILAACYRLDSRLPSTVKLKVYVINENNYKNKKI